MGTTPALPPGGGRRMSGPTSGPDFCVLHLCAALGGGFGAFGASASRGHISSLCVADRLRCGGWVEVVERAALMREEAFPEKPLELRPEIVVGDLTRDVAREMSLGMPPSMSRKMSPVWVMGIFTGASLSTVIDQDPHDFRDRCTVIPLAKSEPGFTAGPVRGGTAPDSSDRGGGDRGGSHHM